MKKFLSIAFALTLFALSAAVQAQDYRIYYTSADQIRVDNADGTLYRLSPAKDLKIVKRGGTKIGFTFSGFGLTLLPSQVRKIDSTAYGATVDNVIAAFISAADPATDQTVVTSTSTGTLAASTYSLVELTNIHASTASSVVVGGNTVSIPAGVTLKFEAIRSPKTGRYKPIPAIAYTATSSALRIRTVLE